jgi:Phage integrase SAM-like domain
MGQIRKINDVYYIEFYARGLLYSQAAGSDLQGARDLLQQVEAKIAGGEALTIARLIDLPDFFERFTDDASRLYSVKTVRRFSAVIERFNGFLKEHFSGIHRLDQIFPVVLESYKGYLARTQKPKTVNFNLLLMREVLESGIRLGFINDNPCLHVRLLPWPKRSPLKHTPRFDMAKRLLSQGVGLGKLTQLLKLPDIGRAFYFANLIPLNREDVYN